MARAERPFRLNFWMTVCALPALMLLIGLGVWQLQRLDWKEKLIAERTALLARPAIALADLPAGDWKAYDLRRVKLSGRFLHDRSFEIVNRTLRGRPGVHIVTPMVLDGGGTVLVNRGWAPPTSERRPDEIRLPQGKIAIEGILRTGGKPNPWVPDNEPAKGVWFFTEPAAMAAAAGLEDARPYVVEAGPSNAALPVYPVGGQTFIHITNNHLQYALTWFGLAGALIAIYLLYHRRRRS